MPGFKAYLIWTPSVLRARSAAHNCELIADSFIRRFLPDKAAGVILLCLRALVFRSEIDLT